MVCGGGKQRACRKAVGHTTIQASEEAASKKAGYKAGKDSKKGAKQNTESMKVAEFKVVY